MRRRLFNSLLTSMLALAVCIGCGNHEEKARAMFNKAQVLIREGKEDEGKKLLQQLISKHPETEVATDANQTLNAIYAVDSVAQEKYNRIAKLDLKNTFMAQMAYNVDHQRFCNSIEPLIAEHGLYLSDGVTISIVEIGPDGDTLTMKASHRNGNKIFVIGTDGEIREEQSE